MDRLMITDDSYAERRQLFKNIWETAMTIEGKDVDIMSKPKVIKTLRLDEVDRYGIGKKKKLKLKNLRTVCNKILDFCDRQDADDQFYEQLSKIEKPQQPSNELKSKKAKNIRPKKRIKRSKSLNSPSRSPTARATTSEGKDEATAEFTKTTIKRATRKTANKASASMPTNDFTTKSKKIIKRKKDLQGFISKPSGITNRR